MILDLDWASDRARYPTRAFLREQSIWAVYVYRLGRRIDRNEVAFQTAASKLYWLLYRSVETLIGISIPKECKIGPGLRIWHFGGIFIHPKVVIGANCTLRQGVTIGNKVEGGAAPRIGDNVDIGAYAQIIGEIVIGDRARIGAAAVVVKSVPDGATVVGNPARIIDGDPSAAVIQAAMSTQTR